MTTYFESGALARSGYTEDAARLLLSTPTTRAELVKAWEAHETRSDTPLAPPASRVLVTAHHVDRYVELHRRLFGLPAPNGG